MPQQPVVTLTDEERMTLETFVHRGKANAHTLTRARILPKSAKGWSTSALVVAFDVCEATVANVRRRFAQGGLEAVLHDKVQQCRHGALSRCPPQAGLALSGESMLIGLSRHDF